MFKHHAMNTYVGVEIKLHAFLTSVLYGVDWTASSSGWRQIITMPPGQSETLRR